MVTVIAEPRILGEVLKDPGFEDHVANTGGGPLGVEIPFYVSDFETASEYPAADRPPEWCFPALTWSDKSCAPVTTGWAQQFGTFPNSATQTRTWRISTLSPQAGASHVRSRPASETPGGPHWLFAIRGQSCRKRYRAYSARVQPDDTLTWSAYWRHVGLVSGGVPSIVTVITWWDSNWASIPFTDFFSSSQILTGTYTKYTWTRVAPLGAHYALVATRMSFNAPNAACQVDVDTASLVVAGDA